MKLLSSVIAWPLALAVASASSAPPKGSNLHLKVHCPNVDFKDLSAEDGATVGKALMDTYKASRDTDVDDSSLAALGFIGHELEDAPSNTRVHFHPAYFYGTFKCKKCFEDKDNLFHQDWERLLSQELASLGVEAFENVDDCKIRYGLTGVLADKPSNSEISLKCKGIRLKDLTVEESTFVSHSVESTFNAVHRAIPGDESHLGDVFVESDRRSMLSSGNLGISNHPTWCWWWIGCEWDTFLGGDYGPEFCYHDDIWWDDDVPGGRPNWGKILASPEEEDATEITLSGAEVTKAWGDMLTAKLRQGPFRTFHGITSCEVSLAADGVLVESDVVVAIKKE